VTSLIASIRSIRIHARGVHALMAEEHRRRAADRIPAHVKRLLSITDEERVSLRDAIHVALSEWKRRAGDEQRWRSLLDRLSPSRDTTDAC
jgi:hypothetical protein